MAFLYVSEFKEIGPNLTNPDASGWVTDQKIAIGVSTAPSAAFSANTKRVRISTDAICSIAWTLPGASVNAATISNLRLPAGITLDFDVLPGMIVSNISNT